MTIKRLGRIATILAGASLIAGSSFGISAQFQDEVPGKNRQVQKVPQQQEGDPAPELIAYWQALNARSKEPLTATWSKRTGTPESIFGRVPTRVTGASEMSARSFLAENAQLFKMNSKQDDLNLISTQQSPIGKHYIFEQYYHGVRVHGAQVGIHFNQNGEIVTVNNTYQPGIAIESVEPRLSRSSAAARALASVRQTASSRADSELVIASFNNSFRLSWRVVISTDGPTWEMFVDAQNGQLLNGPNDINRYVDGFGQVFIVNAVVATHDNSLRDNFDAASAVPFSAYTIVTLQGLLGNGFLDGTFASSATTKKRAFNAANSFLFDRSNDGFSETMGYYYFDYAERYIQTLGFTNVNNRQQVFAVNRLKVDNSFYSPQSKEISLGLAALKTQR